MRDTVRLGLVLMLICTVTAGALAYVNKITKPLIAESKEKILQDSLGSAYPGAQVFKSLPGSDRDTDTGKADIRKIYQALTDGKPVGFVAEVTSKGYSSTIRMLVGVGLQGTIQGVAIVEQTETPGLGTKIAKEEFRSKYTRLDTPQAVKVKKDGGMVDAITGATISSRAVSTGVSAALEAISALPAGQ